MDYMQAILQAAEEENVNEINEIVKTAIESESADQLYQLAEQLQGAGFLVQAENIYQQLLLTYPDADDLRLSLAEIAIEEGRNEQAFTYLDAISPFSDAYPAALLTLADLYQVLGMPDVSEQKLLAAKELVENEALLDFALAELYYTNGHFREALRLYQQLIAGEEDVPKGVSLYERAGSCLTMLGELEEALPYFEEAAKDELPSHLYELGFLYHQLGEQNRAIAIFKRLIEVDPEYPHAFLQLGDALLEENQVEEALRTYIEGIRRNPFDPELYLRAAETSWGIHEEEQAERWLLAALDIVEEEEMILLPLAHLYFQQGKYAKVVEYLADTEEPSSQALWDLAEAYNELEEYTKAGQAYAKGYEQLKNEPEFLKSYAYFLREEGQFAKAHELLLAYSQLVPDDLEVQGLLQEDQGD